MLFFLTMLAFLCGTVNAQDSLWVSIDLPDDVQEIVARHAERTGDSTIWIRFVSKTPQDIDEYTMDDCEARHWVCCTYQEPHELYSVFGSHDVPGVGLLRCKDMGGWTLRELDINGGVWVETGLCWTRRGAK